MLKGVLTPRGEVGRPHLFSPVKKLSKNKNEDKNPYMGSRGTPVKRKLVEDNNIKTLISLFDTRLEPVLPGDENISESPAKRRRRQLDN